MWICGKCNAQNVDSDDFCTSCGVHKLVYETNYCINPDCRAYKEPLKNPRQLYCGKCGSPTLFGKTVEDQC